ncbi:hypothetical protein GBA52_025789 [Prunus armeniaca]|nr:hypothetical protein GBA52_025789 [Prunus armeniaca]
MDMHACYESSQLRSLVKNYRVELFKSILLGLGGILLDSGGGGTSITRKCDVFRTSRCCKPSNIMIKASFRALCTGGLKP